MKRPADPQSELSSSTQAAILSAARACFARNGFDKTSIADIQALANISRGSIYHYFESKDEIINGILDENLAKIAEKVNQLLFALKRKEISNLEIILKALAGLLDLECTGPERGLALHCWSAAMGQPKINSAVTSSYEAIRLLLEQHLKELKSQGIYRESLDPERVSVALFSVVIPGFMLQRLFFAEQSLGPDAYIDSMMQLFLWHPN